MREKIRKENLTEEGNIIDQLGSIIVMVFVFAMILANAAYGKTVQMKLSIDNIAKEYLYAMEQNGILDADNKNNMVSDLADIGVTVVDDFAGSTVEKQAAYGDKVKLICHVQFENPLYSVFENGVVVTIPGFVQTIDYEINMSATSKW